MTIALLIDTLFGGGSEGVLRRLALGLARRGHRVYIYCLKQAGTSIETLRTAGVVVREAHSHGRDPLLAWRLARWLRTDRVEVVHAHACAALVWVFPAAKLLGLPLVHVRHGWPLSGPNRYVRLADRLDGFIQRVVIVCESGRQKLPRGRIARQAVHIPNGVDARRPLTPARARQRLEELCGHRLDGPVLLSIANVRAEKDIRGLLHAFALLRRRKPEATLVCLGAQPDPAYWADVQHDLHARRLEDHVAFPGHVPGARRLMTGADVLCLSSQTEGMPNVILEAMAQSVPIVATAVGDVGGLGPRCNRQAFLLRHDETALLVPPGDPSAMAAALDRVLDDPAAARRRAARARADYERSYTTARMVQRYERLLADCLHRGARESPPKRRPPRAKRPAVLMIGPAAPRIGGMVSAIDGLIASRLREQYDLYRFATTVNTAPPEPGRPLTLPRRARAWWASVARHLETLARLGQVVVRRRIVLVHIHTCSYFTFYRNLLDLLLVRLLGCKVLVDIRGGRFARFCAETSRPGRWLIRWGCELTDAVVALSQGWRTRLAPFVGRARLVVIPNGVAIPPARPSPPRTSTVCRFLFLGPLTEAKGLGDLIAAGARLLHEGTPFHLVIAGPASDEGRAAWQERVRRAGLTRHVTFTGPVHGVRKLDLFASADCFVHPSHSEGLPFAILEAAASGLPVIATAVGAVPEALLSHARGYEPEPRSPLTAGHVRRGELLAPLVPPQDPPALAREMRRLALDPPRRARIGRALRTHVAANYNVAQQVTCVARLYQSILGRRARVHAPPTAGGAPAPPAPGPLARPGGGPCPARKPHAPRPLVTTA